ncbi:GNAT family N-acetyltransferase [Longirhabdus pacifica]|uniref:GNAT family N-acetyltransferase n=1 Tax=Longirhabdus pacifica TaxID=2305227 RepID=UPI001F0C0C6D|nr:GNAT family protein [Longirhabdus pacifica]
MGEHVKFLVGDLVYLRPPEQSDVDLFYNGLYRSEETRILTGSQKIFFKSEIHKYFDTKAGDDSSIFLLIVNKENDEVIGDIGINGIDRINRNGWIRIAINDEADFGKGYGTEAMQLLLDYAFGVVQLHRIELHVYTFNERAIKSYEKLGFKREGVLREVLFYNHEYHDAISMSILEQEYRALHGIVNGD